MVGIYKYTFTASAFLIIIIIYFIYIYLQRDIMNVYICIHIERVFEKVTTFNLIRIVIKLITYLEMSH